MEASASTDVYAPHVRPRYDNTKAGSLATIYFAIEAIRQLESEEATT